MCIVFLGNIQRKPKDRPEGNVDPSQSVQGTQVPPTRL